MQRAQSHPGSGRQRNGQQRGGGRHSRQSGREDFHFESQHGGAQGGWPEESFGRESYRGGYASPYDDGRDENESWRGGNDYQGFSDPDIRRPGGGQGDYGRVSGGQQDYWGAEGSSRQAPWATFSYGNGRAGSRDSYPDAPGYYGSRFGGTPYQPAANGPSGNGGQDFGHSQGMSNYASQTPYRGGSGNEGRSSNWRERSGPKGYVRSDERIKDDVCERLYQREELDVGDVSIDVKDGRVTLEGSVNNREMKHRIEDIVDDCIGVQEVENRLKIARDRTAEQTPSTTGSNSSNRSGRNRSGGAESPGSETSPTLS